MVQDSMIPGPDVKRGYRDTVWFRVRVRVRVRRRPTPHIGSLIQRKIHGSSNSSAKPNLSGIAVQQRQSTTGKMPNVRTETTVTTTLSLPTEVKVKKRVLIFGIPHECTVSG